MFADRRRSQNSHAALLSSEDKSSNVSLNQTQWSRFRNAMRAVRLQFISPILGHFKTLDSRTEYRKVAMHQSRSVAVFHVLLHLLPLAGAIALLVLQWSRYWIAPQTNVSTILQFAAKVHELTMQASLIEVLLCCVRTAAIDGFIPLGALSGATQPTQLAYLWSLDFLAIFSSSAMRGWRKITLILALSFLLIMVSLVGPSSAILIIPRSDTPHIFTEWE